MFPKQIKQRVTHSSMITSTAVLLSRDSRAGQRCKSEIQENVLTGSDAFETPTAHGNYENTTRIKGK